MLEVAFGVAVGADASGVFGVAVAVGTGAPWVSPSFLGVTVGFAVGVGLAVDGVCVGVATTGSGELVIGLGFAIASCLIDMLVPSASPA